MSRSTLRLIAAADHLTVTGSLKVMSLKNDEDPRRLNLDGVDRVDLNFPKFTDGRAFSQAFLLRRRLGFKGEIRATGDVLIDQLQQMQRSGFDAAVLREDQNPDFARRQLNRYPDFYQGDAVAVKPRFAATGPACHLGTQV